MNYNLRKLEIHYALNDETHSMDAYIRNKCEHELLMLIKHIGEIYDIELDIESEAYQEGGVIERLKINIKKYPTLAAIFIGVLINVISNHVTTDRELNDLQKQHLRLSIEKLKKELKEEGSVNTEQTTEHVDEASALLNNDTKVQKHKSNFYLQLNTYHKVSSFESSMLSEDNNTLLEPSIVDKKDFALFIHTSDELPPKTDETAIIEIVSPVLKRGKYKWKGIYKDQIIDFYMKDKDFKESVINQNQSFNNGSYIECILEISQKITDTGEIMESGHSVITVIKKDDGIASVLTKQGKKYLNEKDALKQQLSFNFKE